MVEYIDRDHVSLALQVVPCGAGLVSFIIKDNGDETGLVGLPPDSVAALIGQLDSWLARVQVEADE